MLRGGTKAIMCVTVLLASCAESTTDGGDDSATKSGPPGDGRVAVVDEERCEENLAFGTVTFLTGFDYAAAASIIEVITAADAGYYEDVCLDVEILPSGSTANYALVAGGEAQFASGGSFSEMVSFARENQADLVALSVGGHTPIDGLIVKEGVADSLTDLAGSRIGVKFKLPSSIEAMLLDAGLVEGDDYETVLLDGFDPLAHIAIESIDGFPGWKSNEPLALDRAAVGYDLFDPTTYGVPGSFGVIFADRRTLTDAPGPVRDFMRATMRGLSDAISNPTAASAAAVALIESGGNPNFLSTEGEAARWRADAQLIESTTSPGVGLAVPNADALQRELDVYGDIGLFGDAGTPSAADFLAPGPLELIYDAQGALVWP